MSPLHPRVNPEHVHADGFLLNARERALVARIQGDINAFKTKAEAHLKQRADSVFELEKLNALREIAEDPNRIISNILFQIDETPSAYQNAVFNALAALKAQYKEPSMIVFLDDLLESFRQVPLLEDSYEIQSVYLEKLDEIFSLHEENAIDNQLLNMVVPQIDAQNALKEESDTAIQVIQNKIAEYQAEKQLDFEIDNDLNMLKISKRSEGLSFSVLFVKGEDKTSEPEPYILYHGKGQILGAGEIGQVKLCQNFATGDWQAVKILPAYKQEGSQFENEALTFLGRYHGDTLRPDAGYGKYYAVQTLLPGKDLESHIQSGESATLESRLEIAKQAIACVTLFHEGFLHRDIKTDNFIWDEANKTLYLCDVGYACKPGDEGIERFGTGDYIAPEIMATMDGEPMPYSKKSDIYALGKTFERLFEDIAQVPESVQTMIVDMTKENPEARLGDMQAMELILNEALEEAVAAQPDTARPF